MRAQMRPMDREAVLKNVQGGLEQADSSVRMVAGAATAYITRPTSQPLEVGRVRRVAGKPLRGVGEGP